MLRFAVNLGFMFADRPLLERFGAAAAAGFDAVEAHLPYDIAPSAVKAEIERHGLTMLGINTAPGRKGEFGLGALPGREADFEILFRQSLDYITAIGGRAIHCTPGVVPPEQRPAADKTFAANLARAADAAAAKNIMLLIEPINTRDRPDYFLHRAEHAADIIARLGKPNVKLQYDFYHNQIMGGDVLKRFEKFLPVIGHAQIAAVPSRHEPDEGELNYPEILRFIEASVYQGFVAAEYLPRGKTEEGLGWAAPYGITPRRT